jgi:MinD-like ATPase involved in chromosome partitioning or flagellar assembly
MAIIALVGGKGSPGVTTTALAFTLSWGRSTILAECDPAGGSIQIGYLRGELPGGRGLLQLAIAELRNDSLAEEFWGQLVDLDAPHRQRLLLPGLTDPAQAGTVDPLWTRFAAFFAGLEYQQPAYDVVVDCGRLAATHSPLPLVWAADAALVVVRPTLASTAAALPVVDALKEHLRERAASLSALGLVVVGHGPYAPAEVARQLKAPLVAHLPDDARAAATLTHGGDVRLNWALMRAARQAEGHVLATITHHRQQVPRRAVLGEAIRGTAAL